MDIPYTNWFYMVGVITGVLAGIIGGNGRLRILIQTLLIIGGSLICGWLTVQIVDWNYDHPFNPKTAIGKGSRFVRRGDAQ